MFNSVALNVVIGLVFIYLLYSLLATVLAETIATFLNLRARNLKEAIGRMLDDEKDDRNFFQRLGDSLLLMKTSKSNIVKDFYNHPEIKYLGSSGVFKSPSNFKAKSFSKTLISLLVGEKMINKENIETILGKINSSNISPEILESLNNIFGSQTANYIRSLWQESQGDIEKFKLQLESWFDRTMEHTIEWYKRKIRVVTFIIGLCIAWFFNADTFVIVKNLSVDKDARDNLVNMATAYVQNNKIAADTLIIKDTVELKEFSERLDSLLTVKKQLVEDIKKANYILGSGCWPPDTVYINIDPKTNVKYYTPPIDVKSLSQSDKETKSDSIIFSFWEKVGYMFKLLYHHFFGFFITAIAISLGAPFWFDLLNKLMQLRTSKKEGTDATNTTTTDQSVSPLNRVG